jgi:DHA2 family multidrug resistance protein-like MFS transporter
MSGGLALGSLGFAMFTRIDATTGFAWFAAGSTIFSLALSPVFTLTTDLIVGAAPPERAGAAAAISETSAELGGALGIAVFGSIGVAIYRRLLGHDLPPGVPAHALEAAKTTLAAALGEARALPAPLGAALTSSAQSAFVRGLQLCAGISAIGSLGLALLVAVATRRRPS